VILGAPNPNTAQGRRLFVDGTADNKGIKDRGTVESTASSSKIRKPSHSNSHSATSRLSRPPPSKSHRSRKVKAALLPSSASEEAIKISDDSEPVPPPKCQSRPGPEVAVQLNKRKREIPDSSGTEDDKPVTKTFKMKTIMFAPQDSSEEEYDDPFANDDPSEVGDASRSPPRL
jgi:hypothetical protein